MNTTALGASLADRALDRVSGGRPIPGNKVELLFDGPEVYPAMLDRIAEARHWVHFDNYIIRLAVRRRPDRQGAGRRPGPGPDRLARVVHHQPALLARAS
jgi:phosphatidylserine/phosphatidylglycerophosphate/cardiolipin synthase-like enzyme